MERSRYGSAPLTFLLLIASLGLVVWQHFGMVRTLLIDSKDPQWALDASGEDDGNGHSSVHLIRTDSSVIMEYDIQPGSPYPFCQMHMRLASTMDHGKDLSWAQEIHVASHFQGIGNGSFRIFFKNFNPAYSDTARPISLKFNEIEYQPEREGARAEFSFQDLRVASWWIGNQNIPTRLSRVEMSNVSSLELHTGTRIQFGPGRFELLRIELRGKWISKQWLYGALLLAWLSFLTIQTLRLLWKERRHSHRLELRNSVLQTHSQTDPLTGILNRRGARDVLQCAYEHSQQGNPCGVVMLDIDHFKHVNDQWGHAVGDQVLARTIQEIKPFLPEESAIVRWGGEEFLLLLCGHDQEQSHEICRKILLHLRTVDHPTAGIVRCSIGISILNGSEISKVIDQADQALYQAKHQGRD
jgi:diguanylate cyclase (GGDEF)-like protein